MGSPGYGHGKPQISLSSHASKLTNYCYPQSSILKDAIFHEIKQPAIRGATPNGSESPISNCESLWKPSKIIIKTIINSVEESTPRWTPRWIQGSATAPLPRFRGGSAGRLGGHLLQTHRPWREGRMAPGRCAAAETDGPGGLCGDAWGEEKAWKKGEKTWKNWVLMGQTWEKTDHYRSRERERDR